jgi:hypothetical protein
MVFPKHCPNPENQNLGLIFPKHYPKPKINDSLALDLIEEIKVDFGVMSRII